MSGASKITGGKDRRRYVVQGRACPAPTPWPCRGEACLARTLALVGSEKKK
jgi:hypothetical protein